MSPGTGARRPEEAGRPERTHNEQYASNVDGVTVRRLGRGDEREVERFGEAFDDPIDAAATCAFLDDDRHHLLVAYVDRDPAGFVSATEILHPDKPLELILNEIGDIERFTPKGAGLAFARRSQTTRNGTRLTQRSGCSQTRATHPRWRCMRRPAGPGGWPPRHVRV